MPVDVHVPEDAFRMPLTVRYYEADQQKVVFHGWYLNYFDEAFMAYLDSVGFGYDRAHADKVDFMVVHSEIDWHASLRWPSAAQIAVSPVHIGTSSLTVDFAAICDGEAVCSARNVYVTIDLDEQARIPAPGALREAVANAGPLRRPRAGR